MHIVALYDDNIWTVWAGAADPGENAMKVRCFRSIVRDECSEDIWGAFDGIHEKSITVPAIPKGEYRLTSFGDVLTHSHQRNIMIGWMCTHSKHRSFESLCILTMYNFFAEQWTAVLYFRIPPCPRTSNTTVSSPFSLRWWLHLLSNYKHKQAIFCATCGL